MSANSEIIEDLKSKNLLPQMYNVLLLNDNVTTMDFVVFILEKVFDKSHSEAVNIMLKVHEQGEGIAGTYVREVAETKVSQVASLARQKKFPLKCRMEEA